VAMAAAAADLLEADLLEAVFHSRSASIKKAPISLNSRAAGGLIFTEKLYAVQIVSTFRVTADIKQFTQ